ncbi:MAG: hypothetical protein IKZ31_07650, partial [Lentisphaeria bacterium]|nr:hypothetical protein [Lentisphaeria bacterium]
FLLFLCFALVELFLMISRQMIIDYSAFYGSKGLALGYAAENCFKATRIAASGISGRDISSAYQVPMQQSNSAVRDNLRIQAARYMSLGRASGVEYEYWYSTSGDEPHFNWGMSPYNDTVKFNMVFENPPFLMEAMKKLMSLSCACSGRDGTPEPRGAVEMFNYSKIWLNE